MSPSQEQAAGPFLVVSAHAGDFVWRAGGATALASARDADARSEVSRARPAAQARADQKDATRAAFRSGDVGLDRYGLGAVLTQLGAGHLDYRAYLEAR